MQKLLDRMAALESAMQEAQRERDAAARHLNRWRGLAAVLALLVVVGLAPQAGHAQLTIDQRVAALEAKLKFLTTSGTSMLITGANLVIRNGGGGTGTTNGLGNLILGYNEMRPLNPNGTNPNLRTGSHNLVLGARNNYSSYSGMVAGDTNAIRAAFASVIGGYQNTASGYAAMVSGGQANTASSTYASVSGGLSNIASSTHTSVSGGYQNTARSAYASVSGGFQNIASGNSASVSGGRGNTAGFSFASVSGGEFNTASGTGSSVSGGGSNSATGGDASVSGGYLNLASGLTASVSGGAANGAGGDYSSVSGGSNITQPNGVGWSGGGNSDAGFFHLP